MGVKLKSFGHYIPQHKVTNAELADRFDISEDWILERTGIEARSYLLESATSDMIVAAALDCLAKTDCTPTDIDCIIVATMTSDYYCPYTAAIVHKKLGTVNAFGFDIMAACSGYIYALQLGTSSNEAKMSSNYYDSEPEIDILSTGAIALYPNPTNGLVHLKIPYTNTKKYQATLYNLLGKSIITQSEVVDGSIIDLSYLRKGTYIIVLRNDNETITKTLLLE